ncbi:MAG: hypothetical protein B6I32_04105, partial [Desulfobacterium sp. 4572_20]
EENEVADLRVADFGWKKILYLGGEVYRWYHPSVAFSFENRVIEEKKDVKKYKNLLTAMIIFGIF